jgi:hypothetical protein
LFIATLIGLGGVTGMFALKFNDVKEEVGGILCLIYGLASFVFAEIIVIKNLKHYKSGVTEALIYHAGGFSLTGIILFFDLGLLSGLIFALFIGSFIAFRYLDLINMLIAFVILLYLVFEIVNDYFPEIISFLPFIYFGLSLMIYYLVKNYQRLKIAFEFQYVLWLSESLALIIIYASVNYLVVRELSIKLLGLPLQPGEDIPFAWLFYSLTILIPVLYLWIGLKKKDAVMYRVSLVVLAFTVFTFKYYYSFNRPEITLTISGLILIAIGLYLFRWLRQPKFGFTTEELLKENWNSQLIQSVLASQTLGGNKIPEKQFEGGGGTHSGGGASGGF